MPEGMSERGFAGGRMGLPYSGGVAGGVGAGGASALALGRFAGVGPDDIPVGADGSSGDASAAPRSAAPASALTAGALAALSTPTDPLAHLLAIAPMSEN